MKFRVPHAFLNFCVDGRVLLLDPTLSISIVEIRDVKDLVNHSHFNGIIESIESFKGINLDLLFLFFHFPLFLFFQGL